MFSTVQSRRLPPLACRPSALLAEQSRHAVACTECWDCTGPRADGLLFRPTATPPLSIARHRFPSDLRRILGWRAAICAAFRTFCTQKAVQSGSSPSFSAPPKLSCAERTKKCRLVRSLPGGGGGSAASELASNVQHNLRCFSHVLHAKSGAKWQIRRQVGVKWPAPLHICPHAHRPRPTSSRKTNIWRSFQRSNVLQYIQRQMADTKQKTNPTSRRQFQRQGSNPTS